MSTLVYFVTGFFYVIADYHYYFAVSSPSQVNLKLDLHNTKGGFLLPSNRTNFYLDFNDDYVVSLNAENSPDS